MMKRTLLVWRVMISAARLVRQAMTQTPPESPLLISAFSIFPVRSLVTRQGDKGEPQERQGYLHRLHSDLTPPDVAKTALTVERDPLSAGNCEMDEADRLLVAASDGSGRAGDGDGDAGRRLRQRTLRHGSCNRLAHGTMGGQ